MPPKLNRRRAVFVLGKIDQILAWEQQKETDRDTKFVELARYLCEVRAGQYWRLENLKCQPWTIAAAVTGGVGVALGVVGGLLFALDTPPAPSQIAAAAPEQVEGPSLTVGPVPLGLGAQLGAWGRF